LLPQAHWYEEDDGDLVAEVSDGSFVRAWEGVVVGGRFVRAREQAPRDLGNAVRVTIPEPAALAPALPWTVDLGSGDRWRTALAEAMPRLHAAVAAVDAFVRVRAPLDFDVTLLPDLTPSIATMDGASCLMLQGARSLYSLLRIATHGADPVAQAAAREAAAPHGDQVVAYAREVLAREVYLEPSVGALPELLAASRLSVPEILRRLGDPGDEGDGDSRFAWEVMGRLFMLRVGDPDCAEMLRGDGALARKLFEAAADPALRPSTAIVPVLRHWLSDDVEGGRAACVVVLHSSVAAELVDMAVPRVARLLEEEILGDLGGNYTLTCQVCDLLWALSMLGPRALPIPLLGALYRDGNHIAVLSFLAASDDRDATRMLRELRGPAIDDAAPEQPSMDDAYPRALEQLRQLALGAHLGEVATAIGPGFTRLAEHIIWGRDVTRLLTIAVRRTPEVFLPFVIGALEDAPDARVVLLDALVSAGTPARGAADSLLLAAERLGDRTCAVASALLAADDARLLALLGDVLESPWTAHPLVIALVAGHEEATSLALSVAREPTFRRHGALRVLALARPDLVDALAPICREMEIAPDAWPFAVH
jgi:hypothetical protein